MLNLGGQFIATAMQLNFAQAYSPTDNSQTNVIGSFYQVFGMLIFITLHGPLILFELIHKSFIAMPLCASFISDHQIKALLNFSQCMFVFSLLLALPIMATMLIIDIGMAVISRLSTVFNIFTIGFPVSILVGSFTLIITLPQSLHYFIEILNRIFTFIVHWQMMG